MLRRLKVNVAIRNKVLPTNNLSKNNRPVICFYSNTDQEEKVMSEYHSNVGTVIHVSDAESLLSDCSEADWNASDVVLVYDSHLLSVDVLHKFSSCLQGKMRCGKPFGGIKIVFLYDFYCLVNFTSDLMNYFEHQVPEHEIHFSNLDKEVSCVRSSHDDELEIF